MADASDLTETIESPEVLKIPDVLPVMAMRDAVMVPFAIIPLTVGREISIRAVDEALAHDRLIQPILDANVTCNAHCRQVRK